MTSPTRSRPSRSACRGFFVAAGAAVVLPMLPIPGSSFWARPDRGLPVSLDLAGPFQDPHDYSAFLVLVVGIVVGLVAGQGYSPRHRTFNLTGLCLVGLALVALLRTHSLVGFVAVGVSLLVVVALLAPGGSGTPSASKRFDW